jgi:hypothetical protein
MHIECKITHQYHIWCYDKDGNFKWEETIENLVPYDGRDKYLDATLKTGLASPAWYIGLIGAKTTGYSVSDVMNSHGGWTESTAYDGDRQAFTPGTINSGSVSNSASKAAFTINATATIYGCFMASNNTKGGTTGILLGEGDFSGSSQAVVDDDILYVQVTCSLS